MSALCPHKQRGVLHREWPCSGKTAETANALPAAENQIKNTLVTQHRCAQRIREGAFCLCTETCTDLV